MTRVNPYKKQQEQLMEAKIMSSNPQELVLMMFDRLVKDLMVSKFSFESKNKSYEKINESLINAQNIVISLRDNLDMSIDISKNLYNLYEYILEEITNMNRTKDLSNIDNIIDISKEFRDTWKSILN